MSLKGGNGMLEIVISMDDSEATSLEQIRAFLAGSGEAHFTGQRRDEVMPGPRGRWCGSSMRAWAGERRAEAAVCRPRSDPLRVDRIDDDPVALVPPTSYRVRSEMISRSNWANDKRMFRVSRPRELVVLNC